MADRVASASVVIDPRKLDGGLRRATSRFNRFGKSIKRSIGNSLRGAFSGLSTIGGIGGAAGFALIGRQVLDFEDKMSRLQIQAGASGVEIQSFRRNLNDMSRDTGISRAALIDGAEALVNLQGKAGFSAKQLKVLGDANLATGASMDSLAGLAFSLGNAFNLANPAQLEKGLSAIITAGKEGAVPLGEMSAVLQQVSASFAKLGGGGVGGAADMAASIQILRRGFGSASEAGTGLQAMITGLTKKSAKLGKEGIDVFDKNGKFRGMRAILDDFEAANLSIKQMTDILGRVEGAKAIETLLKFRRTRGKGTKDELIGFEELAARARKSNAVQEDAAKRRQSDAFKIKKAFNDINLAVAEAFTPDRIRVFTRAVQKLASLLDWMMRNPVKSLAGLMALKFGPGALGAILSGGSAAALSGGALAAGGGAAASAIARPGAAALAAAGGGSAAGGVLGTTAAKAAGGVLAAGTAGFVAGTALDRLTGASDRLSDFLAGVTTTKRSRGGVSGSQFDPTGRAASLRTRASQIADKQPGLAESFRRQANEIERGNFDKLQAPSRRRAKFRKLFGSGEGTVKSRLAGQGKFSSEGERLGLSVDEARQIFSQLRSGPLANAEAFAQGAPIGLKSGDNGKITIFVKVDNEGNVTAGNSKEHRRGN